jgi:hypothetical protein
VTQKTTYVIRIDAMKSVFLLLIVLAAMGVGFMVGKRDVASVPANEQSSKPTREGRPPSRASRVDPFGGPSFSVDSLEDVRELFKSQRSEVASARLTLAVESLSNEDLSRIMNTVQEDFRNNPNFDQSRWTLMSALFGKWTTTDPSGALTFVHSCKQRSFRTFAAEQCFSSLAQADPDRALKELQSLPKGEMRENVAPGVIAVIGKQDPATACDLLTKEPTRNGWGDYYTRDILIGWAEKDPAAAAERLSSLPDEVAGGNSAGGVAAAWARQEPEAALAWAKSLKGQRKAMAFESIYTVLSRENPSGAWEKLKGEPGHLRGSISGKILQVIADEDPAKAMAMLKSMAIPSEKRIATNALLENLGWSQTRLAFDLVSQLDDPSTRREQLGNLMYNAAWSSANLLKEQAAKLTEREKIETSQQVLQGLVKSSPKAAEEYFLSLPESQRTPQSLQYMMGQYASKDSKAALDFALSLGNIQERNAAFTGLFNKWGAEDPEGAADGLKKLPAGESRLAALNSIATSWARSDPESAHQWAESLTGGERVRALSAILPSLAKDDPASASHQLAGLLASPPDGMAKNLASSTATLASTWASDNPSDAAAWVASLPPGQWQEDGVGAVAASWTRYDAVAASQWISSLPTGSSRDAAVKPLVQQVRQTDPATAFSWAASISDPDDRVEQIRGALQSWRGTNLAAARAALDGASLTETERTKLQKEVE